MYVYYTVTSPSLTMIMSTPSLADAIRMANYIEGKRGDVPDGMMLRPPIVIDTAAQLVAIIGKTRIYRELRHDPLTRCSNCAAHTVRTLRVDRADPLRPGQELCPSCASKIGYEICHRCRTVYRDGHHKCLEE